MADLDNVANSAAINVIGNMTYEARHGNTNALKNAVEQLKTLPLSEVALAGEIVQNSMQHMRHAGTHVAKAPTANPAGGTQVSGLKPTPF